MGDEVVKKENLLLKFEIIGTIFIMIFGTLLHFVYEWSGNRFFPVNESVWEHLKLLFFPMLLVTIVGYFIFRGKYPNYLCSKVKGILLSMLFIIVFFYTYTGILGFHVAFLDIGSFFVAVLLGQIYSYFKVTSGNGCSNAAAFLILLVLSVCFMAFTVVPPRIGLFEDPVTGNYGI